MAVTTRARPDGSPRHGSSGYTRGCRYPECRAGRALEQRIGNIFREYRLATDPDLEVEHGEPSTYRNWNCRCVLCCDAMRVERRRWPRRARLEREAGERSDGAT